MSSTLRIASRLSLLFALTLAFLVLPSPAPAHVAPNPHVPDAWYKPSEHLVFDKDANVSDGWHFNEEGMQFDSALGPPPDLHFGECEAHPNWGCIRIRQVSNTSDGFIIRWNPDPNPRPQAGTITFNVHGGDYTPHRHYSCRVIAFLFGLHEHQNGGGCTDASNDVDKVNVSGPAMDALRDAYRRN